VHKLAYRGSGSAFLGWCWWFKRDTVFDLRHRVMHSAPSDSAIRSGHELPLCPRRPGIKAWAHMGVLSWVAPSRRILSGSRLGDSISSHYHNLNTTNRRSPAHDGSLAHLWLKNHSPTRAVSDHKAVNGVVNLTAEPTPFIYITEQLLSWRTVFRILQGKYSNEWTASRIGRLLEISILVPHSFSLERLLVIRFIFFQDLWL